MGSIGLKQFRVEGCLSYILHDPASRAVAIVDPNLESMGDYRAYRADHGLKLVAVLETHIHADHFSCSHLLRQEYGCEIAMSEATRSERVTRRLRHGDRIELGAFALKALLTPGHTPDSACYAGDGFVLTGDTLLIGSTGRTDFPGADPAAHWKALHEVLGALPDSTLVLPGHDYSELLFTTIGTEKKRNPHWRMGTEAEFVAFKSAESMAGASDEIRRTVEFNLAARPAQNPARGFGAGGGTQCGRAGVGDDRVAAINVETYHAKLQAKAAGTRFIDVREREEFADGHMPGAENIPLSELGLHLESLRASKRLYVSCLSGRRSGMAVKTLTYVGLPDAVNVTGGFKAWSQSGYPVQK
jgi:glyoxylase-like metal-dependent hydrolase (beta-lactamase superfamily II)/rhodanese-related sulfurtransferase